MVDPLVGVVIAARYRVIERIARGGMGAIYQAQHVVTGKHFAVKVLLPGYGRVEEVTKRFEREARAASALAHPNIVSTVDFGALPDDGSLFLVMELVNGRSLSDVIDLEEVPRPRAFAIARQVLEALAHAHAHGVIHRDLKPDNIMLVDAGASEEEHDIVKLLDFGIAKIVGDAAAAGEKLTQAGVAFGTPDYMSPEQALGEEVDARADLYALGVILYELIAGRTPFDSPDKVAILRMQVAVSPPPIEGTLAPEVTAFIARALAKRRAERFEGAHEMLAALDAAAAAQAALEASARADVATPPLSGPTPIPELAPPLRSLRHGGFGLLAALAAVVLFVVATRRDAPSPIGPRPIVPAPHVPAAVDGAGWRAAGHALVAAGRDTDGLTAYGQALARDPGRADAAMISDLTALLGRKAVALAALDLLADSGDAGRAAVVEQAGRGKTAALRARARDLTSARGFGADVDLLSSFSLDLQQGASCRERRDAIPRLRALRDKGAIAVLKRARGRSGGFLGLEHVNSCLERDAAEAIEFLQALP